MPLDFFDKARPMRALSFSTLLKKKVFVKRLGWEMWKPPRPHAIRHGGALTPKAQKRPRAAFFIASQTLLIGKRIHGVDDSFLNLF